MRTIRAKLETASWLAWLALVGPLFALSHMTPAQAQTYSPHFTMMLPGAPGQPVIGSEVTKDDSFDYGSHPPTNPRTNAPGIYVVLHNGPNPECLFSATSANGAAQYRTIGGSNGYDSKLGYADPAPVDIPLPVPSRWSLHLDCGTAGAITAVVSTEVPPPPTPICPCGTVPGGPLPVSPTPPPPSPAKPTPPPAPRPVPVAPAPVIPKPIPKPDPAAPAPKPDPVSTPTPTPAAVVQTPSPTPTPSASPTPSLSPSAVQAVSAAVGAKVVKSTMHRSGIPWGRVLVAVGAVLALAGAVLAIRRRRNAW